jgi:thiamine biosynthesis lipoprotein
MQRILILLTTTLLTACCNDCTPKQAVTPISGVAMTIPYRILVGSTLSAEQQKEVMAIISSTFNEVDCIYNKYNPESELSKLNRIGAHSVTPISQKMNDIFEAAAVVVNMSEGRFDPTVESLGSLWKEKMSKQTAPTDEEISLVTPSLGWNNVHYAEGQFWKDHPKTQIDLGGIAKGMCVDQLTENLVNAGYKDVYVEWGGEIRTAGKHPEGRSWTVFISRLGDPNPAHAIATIELKDQAVATSGDYLQQWTVGSKVYSHIIDPYSSTPIQVGSQKIASVTVVAPNCTLADALATALMLFDTAKDAQEWAQELQKNHPEISVWILTREGD